MYCNSSSLIASSELLVAHCPRLESRSTLIAKRAARKQGFQSPKFIVSRSHAPVATSASPTDCFTSSQSHFESKGRDRASNDALRETFPASTFGKLSR